ncbi:MAG TPA: sodium:calcium antiporter [Dissulfurispiraceae bacterium]|nr:sodium:calcium antiporter [Dissulfurispiraceae bacterium]
MTDIALLIVSLIMILVSAEVFTNGVEALGRRLDLSQAVVGSVLAAVGTALPETILPFVAIFLHQGEAAKHIGVGAILGAPFMLATLAFFLIGCTAIVRFLMKKRRFELRAEISSTRRDLIFFILMYGAAIVLPFFFRGGRAIIAAGLIAGYCIYVFLTFRGKSGGMFHAEELYGRRLLSAIYTRTNARSERSAELISLICLQVVLSLVLMVEGSHLFVNGLEVLSRTWGLSPLLFSLLAAPVATELPEKFNSISWTFKGKDTLAIGNVTGAMVFQSTFPVSLGLLFTDWELSGPALFSAELALLSAIIVLADISLRKKVSPVTILAGGAFYLIYLTAIILKP